MPIVESPAEQARRTFEQLLALTPEPQAHIDASELIEQGHQIMALRETELVILKMLLRNDPELLRGNTQCQRLRDQIGLRDRQWASALERARGEMARRRLAGQRARQAHRAYQAPGR